MQVTKADYDIDGSVKSSSDTDGTCCSTASGFVDLANSQTGGCEALLPGNVFHNHASEHLTMMRESLEALCDCARQAVRFL